MVSMDTDENKKEELSYVSILKMLKHGDVISIPKDEFKVFKVYDKVFDTNMDMSVTESLACIFEKDADVKSGNNVIAIAIKRNTDEYVKCIIVEEYGDNKVTKESAERFLAEYKRVKKENRQNYIGV